MNAGTLFWVEWNLQNWARFQREGGLPDGAPTEASGGLQCYTSMDFDGMCERMDAELASITAVVVEQLAPAERCAIHAGYLEAVWRFREPFSVILDRSKLNVQQGLRKRGVWLGE